MFPEIVFGQPGLLWGIASAVLPVAIYLLMKRQVRIENWGATRFLQVVVEKRRHQIRLHSILPLLLRILVIVLLVLGASDPHQASDWNASEVDVPVHRLLIVDVSMSMAAEDEEISRFDRALAQLENLFRTSGPNDSWQLLLHGNNSRPERIRLPSYQLEAVASEVRELKPTFQSGNVAATLTRAIRMAEEFPSDSVEVIFFTDLQQSEWATTADSPSRLRELLDQLSRLATVMIVSPDDGDRLSNATVSADAVQGDLSERIDLEVPFKVTSFASENDSIEVGFQVDGESIGTRRVSVGDQNQIAGTMSFQIRQPGVHALRSETRQDALDADNVFWSPVIVHGPVDILIVRGASDEVKEVSASDFLNAALAVPEGAISGSSVNQESTQATSNRIRTIPRSEYSGEQLSECDVVLFCGIPVLTLVEAEQLRQFVETGGGVMFSVDETTSAAAVNQVYGSEGIDLLPALLGEHQSADPRFEESFRFEAEPSTHAIVREFRNSPESGFATTRIYQYLKSSIPEITEADVQRVVDLVNGDPLIVERQVGLGAVVLINTSFEPQWGSWVLWPSFLPMMQEMVRSLSSLERRVVVSTIGSGADPVLSASEPLNRIEDERGNLVWEMLGRPTSTDQLLGTVLARPGVFRLSFGDNGQAQQILFRNCDQTESDLKTLRPGDRIRKEIFQSLNVTVTESLDDPSGYAPFSDPVSVHAYSRWLFFFAFLFLLIDMILGVSYRFGAGMLVGLLSGILIIWSLPMSASAVFIMVTGTMLLGGILLSRVLENQMPFPRGTRISG
ncbi:BatA domain-containing protein [Thalassoglobus sp. JC818]|uniref:BatA domain-containing protein n=1 Tax=Thalassoglobus sp. JC818 TaxID=3232136 RepID=UPI003459E4DB